MASNRGRLLARCLLASTIKDISKIISFENMRNQPIALSENEKTEIASIEAIRQMWGAETREEMMSILQDTAYAVKFNFVSGSPGYVGDYFIIQGDTLTGDRPIELIRDRNGKIIFAYDE